MLTLKSPPSAHSCLCFIFGFSGCVCYIIFSLVSFPQDLLQLQYEGLAVMKMFGRAKINVNLLIYLINKKFYGVQK